MRHPRTRRGVSSPHWCGRPRVAAAGTRPSPPTPQQPTDVRPSCPGRRAGVAPAIAAAAAVAAAATVTAAAVTAAVVAGWPGAGVTAAALHPPPCRASGADRRPGVTASGRPRARWLDGAADASGAVPALGVVVGKLAGRARGRAWRSGGGGGAIPPALGASRAATGRRVTGGHVARWLRPHD